MLWAALSLALGIAAGPRMWRPPAWWIFAAAAFILAATWFLSRRAWMAKGLSLGAWCLLGALLIQIRIPSAGNPRILALANGEELTVTAHVIREGYVRGSSPQLLRQTVDVDTETVENEGVVSDVRAGMRLTIYEKIDPADATETAPLHDAATSTLIPTLT